MYRHIHQLVSFLVFILVSSFCPVFDCLAQSTGADSVRPAPLIDHSKIKYFEEVVPDSNSVNEKYLKPLAKMKQQDRTLNGVIGVVGGAVLIMRGVEVSSEDKQYRKSGEAGMIYLGSGAICALLGVHELTKLSKAEKEYLRIAQVKDSSARDSMAAVSLEQMAGNGRRVRLAMGTTFAVLGVLQLTAFDGDGDEDKRSTSQALAGVDFAAAVFCLVLRSDEERVYNKYLRHATGAVAVYGGPYFGRNGAGLMVSVSF